MAMPRSLSDDEKANLYDFLRDKVVVVNPKEDDGILLVHSPRLKGVGVMIGNGLVLTSAKLSGGKFLDYKFSDNNLPIEAGVLKLEERLDLVILKSKSNNQNAIARLEDATPISYGEPVVTFLHHEDFGFTFRIGHVGSPRVIVDGVIVYRSEEYFDPVPPKVPMIILENFHNDNLSIGAPVFNSRGNLIGMVSYSDSNRSYVRTVDMPMPYDYAVHRDTIAAFIEDVINVDPKDKGKGKVAIQ